MLLAALESLDLAQSAPESIFFRYKVRFKVSSEHVKAEVCAAGFDLRALLILLIGVPILIFVIYVHGQKVTYFLRPIWEKPPKPFTILPHYYHEKFSMDNLCKLHGWKVREAPRRVFDAVLFSNELDILDIRWHELSPYVSEFVLLESNSTFTGIKKDLHFKENRQRFEFAESRLTYAQELSLLIPFLLDDKSWRASVHRYRLERRGMRIFRQTDELLADSGWHCSFCFRYINDFIFKMKAYSHVDRIRFKYFLKPKEDSACDLPRVRSFDMIPEEYTFQEIIAKLGPIPSTYSAVHSPPICWSKSIGIDIFFQATA
ncbi:hypothetical protein HU200_066642 [Digitaria exilis]|uniref:Beta-1,4-mannosyl-glycoprotein 4-beta-N-acetylglucosaminyltransferase n=1 Tax=Digitaria exilis TaxID=1010633 RepID=A0A834ZWC1_9POAL|nr:hypothetical protein HU200_066642 [Digitaria exilis]